jgi:hypothetical protein
LSERPRRSSFQDDDGVEPPWCVGEHSMQGGPLLPGAAMPYPEARRSVGMEKRHGTKEQLAPWRSTELSLGPAIIRNPQQPGFCVCANAGIQTSVSGWRELKFTTASSDDVLVCDGRINGWPSA